MLKNSKFYIFFMIIFCVLILFSQAVFASTERYTFTGFDNNSYDLPSLPDDINNYDHYILLNANAVKYLITFNDTLSISRGSNVYVQSDGCMYTLKGDTWEYSGLLTGMSFASSALVVHCSSEILSYSDEFNNETFFLPLQKGAVGILPPIMMETPLEGVLAEIIAILPIVLMTIVGLIGLRKALSLLSKVLHRS